MPRRHVAIRVSPKGTAFIGKCVACNKDNLSIQDVNTDCPSDMSYEEAQKIVQKWFDDKNKTKQ